MIFSVPVGFVLTKAPYGFGGLEAMGNLTEYFFNGTKFSYMFFMWPLGVLLELPVFLIIGLPLVIIILKIKFGTFGYDQIIASILGVTFAGVVLVMKKRGYFNWFYKKDGSTTSVLRKNIFIQNLFINISILACVVFLTFFLSYYTGEYILVHLSREFRDTGGGFFAFPTEFMRFLIGVPITYAFFIGFLFSLFGKGEVIYLYYLVLPAIFLPVIIDHRIWLLWVLIFFIFGIFIAKLIKKLVTFFKKQQLSQIKKPVA